MVTWPSRVEKFTDSKNAILFDLRWKIRKLSRTTFSKQWRHQALVAFSARHSSRTKHRSRILSYSFDLNYITPLKTDKMPPITCERLAVLNWRSSSIPPSSYSCNYSRCGHHTIPLTTFIVKTAWFSPQNITQLSLHYYFIDLQMRSRLHSCQFYFQLVTLFRSRLRVRHNTGTDRQTDRRRPSTLNARPMAAAA